MDQHIFPAVAIIAAFGFMEAMEQHKSPVRQLIAAGILGIILALMDTLGAGQIAGALAMVAAVYVVITQGGTVLGLLSGALPAHTLTPAQQG